MYRLKTPSMRPGTDDTNNPPPPVVGASLPPVRTCTELVAAAREQAPVKSTALRGEKKSLCVGATWAVLMAHQQWYMTGWDLDAEASGYSNCPASSQNYQPTRLRSPRDQEHALRGRQISTSRIFVNVSTLTSLVDGYVAGHRYRLQCPDPRPAGGPAPRMGSLTHHLP